MTLLFYYLILVSGTETSEDVKTKFLKAKRGDVNHVVVGRQAFGKSRTAEYCQVRGVFFFIILENLCQTII